MESVIAGETSRPAFASEGEDDKGDVSGRDGTSTSSTRVHNRDVGALAAPDDSRHSYRRRWLSVAIDA